MTTTILKPLGAASVRTRSVGLDLARMIGLVCVVIGHTANGDFLWARQLAVSFDVPIFFIISGYLWRPGRTLGAEVRRRARTLLVPYACWAALALVVALCVPVPGTSFGEVVGHLALGGENIREFFGPLWFVSTMFIATVVFRATLPKSPFIPLAIGLTGVVLGSWWRESIAWWPEGAGVAMIAIFYLLCGWAFRRVSDFCRLEYGSLLGGFPIKPVLGACLVVVPAAYAMSGYFGELHLKGAYLGTPVTSVLASISISVGLIMICESAEPFLHGWVASVIRAVTGCGFAIFVGAEIFRYLFTQLFGLDDKGLLIWALSFFPALALGLVLRKTPLRTLFL
ncbi:MAG: acyltransferase family protein [Propionibacteriaceae bacterium]|jgi:hypothetical protein|nr:acyltransferase family protein [Propionibacteriaceae bacterium]